MVIGIATLIIGISITIFGMYLIIKSIKNIETRCWSSNERELNCEIND